MPPEDVQQMPRAGMPNMGGTPMLGAGMQQGMPQGMPEAGGMPMGGEGNLSQELEQFIAQLPQEEINKIIQDPAAAMEEYTMKLSQLEESGGDMEASVNLAKEFVIGVITQEMVKTGKTLAELCPNLAQQMESAGGGQQMPQQGMQQGMEQPQQLPQQQPMGQQPMPSVLGGGR